MRFSKGIISRNGFGATSIRAHFISIFLINAITLNAQMRRLATPRARRRELLRNTLTESYPCSRR